ncbi:MAG: tRNA (adenosine(37)-N6)-dimethylallyltransferase MiaA [Acidisphaera sp.]|nr:tRNA (adenosine(37)-N6)-dimethylallyltransferase MiaA [Acidisphaera sp.]
MTQERQDALAPALLIAGPTCSGKSALAMALAETCGGLVINADAMQVYRELRVLTARPTEADEARVPHALYGVRRATCAGSVAWWRGAALAAMHGAHHAGALPILCGGSGLYFHALTSGIAAIPPIGAAARSEARRMLAELGPQGLHAALASVDPGSAARLRPSDAQRLARGWEVWRETGRGIAAWQDEPAALAPWRFAAIRLDPPRDVLRGAIARRFADMLDAGALDEVRALLALDLDPALPAMRAHGVPELAAHLRGTITLAEAAQRTTLATGQYTKRQATWFAHHALAAPARVHVIHARFACLAQLSESCRADLFSFIRGVG